MIIAFVNQKGGVGKSTTSVHFAVWLKRQGYRVHVVDCDAQKSSSEWLTHMGADIPISVLQSSDELLEQLPRLASDADYLVVDSPAGIAEHSRAILFRADLAVVPVQASGVDLRSARDIVRLIRQAQSVRGGRPKMSMFISRAVKGTRLKKEAIELLSQIEGSTLFDTIVHQRQATADTSGQNVTVWELGDKGAKDASKEYESLFKEIEEALHDKEKAA